MRRLLGARDNRADCQNNSGRQKTTWDFDHNGSYPFQLNSPLAVVMSAPRRRRYKKAKVELNYPIKRSIRSGPIFRQYNRSHSISETHVFIEPCKKAPQTEREAQPVTSGVGGIRRAACREVSQATGLPDSRR